MRERGLCIACGYHVRMRKNGFPERHYLYIGGRKHACAGGEQRRTVADVPRYPIFRWRREDE